MVELPSTAAQIIVSIIPIVGIVFGSTVVFFHLKWSSKQKIIMIEKGLIKESNFDLSAFSLFSGLILISLGLSLTIFFLIKLGFSYGVLSGLIPFSIGISLIFYYKISSK